MAMLTLLITAISSATLASGFSSYISFDDFNQTRIKQGYSQDKLIKWDISGNNSTSSGIIAGFNGTSLMLTSNADEANCEYLKIKPINNDTKQWSTNSSQLTLSFWIHVIYDAQRTQKLYKIASGDLWPHCCWSYYLEVRNRQISSFKTKLVSRAEASILTYKSASFRLNAWNFITLIIKPSLQSIDLHVNLQHIPVDRREGSACKCPSTRGQFLQFGPLATSNCPAIVLDDVHISDHLNETITRQGAMRFCPQDVQTQLSLYECKCWPGFALKTDNLGGICRDCVTCCVDVDECAVKRHHCPPSSSCRNTVGSYDCVSALANAVCRRTSNSGWKCECKPGFRGINCENRTEDLCKKIKCQNGGQCVTEGDDVKCKCVKGFAGTLCELKPIPRFTLLLPKPPPFTMKNLTFLLSTDQTSKNVGSLKTVWHMGDGTTINASRVVHLQNGIIEFHKSLDIKITAKACVPAMALEVSYHYTRSGEVNGSVAIFNGYQLVQLIPFQLHLLPLDEFCRPGLQLTNIFASTTGTIARVDISRSVLVTSSFTFPSQCPSIKTISYEWRTLSRQTDSLKQFRSFNHPTNLPYLKIGSWQLSNGTNVIALRTKIETSDGKILYATVNGVVEAVSPDVSATTFGGKVRSHPANKDAILTSAHDTTDVKYEWICWTQDGRLPKCCLPQTNFAKNNQKQVIIPGRYLQKGMTYLIMRSDALQPQKQRIQQIRVMDDAAPDVVIRCVENCASKSSPMINIILQVSPSDRRVRWSIHKEGVSVKLEWRRKTCPTRNKSMLCIKPNAFASGTSYEIKATLLDRQNKVEGYAVYGIEIADIIPAGKCEVKPGKGVTIIDRFNIKCQGFGYETTDLTYEIYQRNLFTHQKILMGRGVEPVFSNLTLSAGDKRHKHQTELIVIARNWEMVETRVNINVTVFPVSHRLGSRALPNFIANFVSDGTLEQLEITGNLIGAVQLASALTNSIEIAAKRITSTAANAKFSRIRQSLVKNLEAHLPYDVLTVEQSAAVLQQILATSLKQISTDTQTAAIELAENLTRILQRESDVENTDTTHRINGSQSILRAVSNLLFARTNNATPVLNLSVSEPNDYEDRDYFADDQLTSNQNGSQVEKAFEIALTSRSFEVIRQLDIVVQSYYNLRLDTTIKTNKIRATVNSDIRKIKTKDNDVVGAIHYYENQFANLKNISLAVEKLDFNPLPNQALSHTMNTPFVRVALRNASMDDVTTNNQQLSVDLFLHRPRNQKVVEEMVYVDLSKSEMSIHKLEVPTIAGSAVVKIVADDDDLHLKVVTTFGHRPTMDDFNVSHTLPKNDNVSSHDAQTIVVPIVPDSEQTMYLAVLPANNVTKSFSYLLSITFANCYFWDDVNSSWSTKGCTVGPKTSLDYLHCVCSHMSLFSGSVFVLPNFVDPFLDFHLFLTIVDNPIMLIVLAVVYAIYLILLPVAYRLDKKSQQKELIVVEGNEASDRCAYVVLVSTGYQRGSGTTAHVGMQLRGAEGNSRVYVLGHPTQPILQQGSVDAFLITTQSSVGDIKEILIFHDSYGLRPNWYVRTVTVYDVQTDKQLTFSIYRWITIDKARKKFQFVFKSNEKKIRPTNEFNERTSEKLCNDHLLYSIFCKPDLSSFTCVQRLSCLLCVRLMSMLASLMFYGTPLRNNVAQIDAGEFAFTFRQIMIGIQSSLAIIPITFLLIFLFRKSKSNDSPHISVVGSHLKRMSNDKDGQITIFIKDDEHSNSAVPVRSKMRAGDRAEVAASLVKETRSQTCNLSNILGSGFQLPHWCVYVAWTVTFICCAFSSYMIILYGLRYGKVRSLNWLVSTVTATLQGTFLQEPLIIVIQVLLIMALAKVISPSRERKPYVVIQIPKMMKWTKSYFKFQKPRFYSPLPNNKLHEIQQRLIVRRETAARVVEIVGFCLFFTSLWMVVLQIKDPAAYQVTRHVTQTFINYFDEKAIQLNQVTNTQQLYLYITETLLRGLHGDPWNSHAETTPSENHIQLLGVARLRQLRVKPGVCKVAGIVNNSAQLCASNYDTTINDDSNYSTNWQAWKAEQNDSHTRFSPWIYHRSDYLLRHTIYGQLTTYYDDGYVAELGRNMKNSLSVVNYLHEQRWIDRLTRAVFCELTLYNTDYNYFTQLTIVVEISTAGALFTDHNIWTFRPLGYFQHLTPSLVSAIVIFVLLFLICLGWEIAQLIRLRRRYFTDAWNYIDISILIGCVTLFIFYGVYFNTVRQCVDRIHQSKRNVFVSFLPAVTWDHICTSTFGLVVCFNMLKVWKLLTFNKRMYTFVFTVHQALPAIFNFGVMYAIVLMAFVQATYLTLAPNYHVFQSFGRNMLHYVIFSFGYSSFEPYADSWVGHVIFVLFTCVVYYYLVTMLEAIMMLSFEMARKRIESMRNKYEMINYLRENFDVTVKHRTVDDDDAKRNENWLKIENSLDKINELCENVFDKLKR